MRTIEYDAVCRDCGGTGLYVGFAEHNGAAVVCRRCDGTGCKAVSITYEPFRERSVREGIHRVYQCNPGITIGEVPEKGLMLENFGGMPHHNWMKGNPFVRGMEDRQHTCPAWWGQASGGENRFDWCPYGFGVFSHCEHFPEKATCWERRDELENGK